MPNALTWLGVLQAYVRASAGSGQVGLEALNRYRAQIGALVEIVNDDSGSSG